MGVGERACEGEVWIKVRAGRSLNVGGMCLAGRAACALALLRERLAAAAGAELREPHTAGCRGELRSCCHAAYGLSISPHSQRSCVTRNFFLCHFGFV